MSFTAAGDDPYGFSKRGATSPTGGSPTGNNFYGNAPAFGEGRLPGQGTGFGSSSTFDPNALPGQGASGDGSGAGPGAYMDPNADPFNQPRLGGSKGDPNAGKPTGNPNATPAPTPEAPLAGPGYNEDWYKTYGKDLMDTPSASEDLYSKGAAGSNPFYDYAQEQTTKAINDASAARGNFNSSYTMKNIGNAVANLRGQQAHELGMLAAQSDAGKFGRYDRSERYSGDAQDRMENRANRGLDFEFKLSHDQASLVGEFYRAAGDAERQVLLAKIEASLKASGLTAAEAKQMADQLTAGANVVSKFYNPGGGGGGSGSGISTPGSGGGAGGSGDTWYV